MNFKIYHFLRYRVVSLLFVSLLFLLSSTPIQAWDQALIDASKIVAAGGKGEAFKQARALVLSRNYDVNLLAISGEIDDAVYQICQHDFATVSDKIGEDAAKAAGVKFEKQRAKPGEYKPLSPGTDSDYITGATKPEQVKKMQTKYNDDFTIELKKLDDSILDDNWIVKNDIDFMADPVKTSVKNFEEISDLNNAAYRRRGAARYEKYSRGDIVGRPRLQDSVDYMDEMHDMIRHREKIVTPLNKEFKALKKRITAAVPGSPNYALLKKQTDEVYARIFKQRALQAKYMVRINVASENLLKWLPTDSIFLKDGLIKGSKLPLFFTDLPTQASFRFMIKDPASTLALEYLKPEILKRQLQQHLEVMGAVIAHNPGKAIQIDGAIKRYASMLNSQQQDEVIGAIRKQFGSGAADNMVAMFKGGSTDPEFLLRKLFRDVLSEKEFKRAMQAMDDGNFEKLPGKAKQLRDQVFEMGTYKRTRMSKTSTDDVIKRFQKKLKLNGITAESSDTLNNLLKRIDAPQTPSLYKRMFGEKLGKSFAKIKEQLSDKVKRALTKTLATRIPLKTLDNKWTSLELGGKGSVLHIDGGIALATTYYEIYSIMGQNLSPEEESRKLNNAIVSNMPIVGDFFMSVNTAVEGYYEGSYKKGAQAAAYLVIGIAGLVPPAQIGALVAGLGMVGWELGSTAWDLSKQKDIIWAWVASGNWKDYESNGVFKSGKMAGLYDSKGKNHHFLKGLSQKAENKLLLEYFITQGDVFYHAPFRARTETSGLPGVTIRESIYDFSERTVLKSSKKFEPLKTALLNLYPNFDLRKHLMDIPKEGEKALKNYIRRISPAVNPDKDVSVSLFKDLKLEYDALAVKSIRSLRSNAEAEYQARYNLGEAKATIKRVKALEIEYRLPFMKNIDAINDEVLKYFMESLKTPLEKHSIPRRRIDLARKYKNTYDVTIRNRINKIKEIFKRANVTAPSKINPYNLTGYVAPDIDRMKRLESNYGSAIKKARDSMREIMISAMPDRPIIWDNTCVNNQFQKLASNRVRRTHADDIRLLFEEWAGRRGAAAEERDSVIQKINAKNDTAYSGIVTIPEFLWKNGEKALENLYAWEHLTVVWSGTQWAYDAERSYLAATEPIRKRISGFDHEYKYLEKNAHSKVMACMSKLTVQLRMVASEDKKEIPIRGAKVTLSTRLKGATPLKEVSPGNYQINAPEAGHYQIVATHQDYRSKDGQVEIKHKIVQVKSSGDKPPPAMIEKLYMFPANQPILKTVFHSADKDHVATLNLTLLAPLYSLSPNTLKLKIAGKLIKKPAVSLSSDGLTLNIEHQFKQGMKAGSATVQVSVKDKKGMEFLVSDSFNYIPGLILSGYSVDDKGGMPADGKINAGEKIALSLKLQSFEPQLISDIRLNHSADILQLIPTHNITWSLPSMVPLKTVSSPQFEFQANPKIFHPVKIRLAFDVMVGDIKLPKPLEIVVPIYPAAGYVIEFAGVDDKKAILPVNNEDGKATAGEQLELKFRIKNDTAVDLAGFSLAISSLSPWLKTTTAQKATALLSGKEIILSLPAKISDELKEITTVEMKVTLIPDNGGQALNRTFKLTLYPPPLQIRLLNVEVHDPNTGSLVLSNNNNGILGKGEHGFIDIKLINDGPALDDVVIDLTSLDSMVLVEKKMAQGKGIQMPSNKAVSHRFEIKVPVDYPRNKLGLSVKVIPAYVRNLWKTETSIKIEDKALLEGILDLSPKTALHPGAELDYKLVLKSQEKKGKSTHKLDNLNISIWSNDIKLMPPNKFYKQSFTPQQKHSYTGKIKIPEKFSAEKFKIVTDVFNQSGSRRIYRKEHLFDLAMQVTRLSIKQIMIDNTGKRWKLIISVLDDQDNPVNIGTVNIKTSHGILSKTQVPVKNGRAELIWTRDGTVSGQALVEFEYQDDVSDTGVLGKHYMPSKESVFVPPQMMATLKVNVSGNEPLTGVEISVVSPSIELNYTGIAGHFNNISQGTYKIMAIVAGYQDENRTIDIDPIRPDQVITIDIKLKPVETIESKESSLEDIGLNTFDIDAFIGDIRHYYTELYNYQIKVIPKDQQEVAKAYLKKLRDRIEAWEIITDIYVKQISSWKLSIRKGYLSGFLDELIKQSQDYLAELNPDRDPVSAQKRYIERLKILQQRAKSIESKALSLFPADKELKSFYDSFHWKRPYNVVFNEKLYGPEMNKGRKVEEMWFPDAVSLNQYNMTPQTPAKVLTERFSRLDEALEAVREYFLPVQKFHKKITGLITSTTLKDLEYEQELIYWEKVEAQEASITGKYHQQRYPKPKRNRVTTNRSISSEPVEGFSAAASFAIVEKYIREEFKYMAQTKLSSDEQQHMEELRNTAEKENKRLSKLFFNYRRGYGPIRDSMFSSLLQRRREQLLETDWQLSRASHKDSIDALRNRSALLKGIIDRIHPFRDQFTERNIYWFYNRDYTGKRSVPFAEFMRVLRYPYVLPEGKIGKLCQYSQPFVCKWLSPSPKKLEEALDAMRNMIAEIVDDILVAEKEQKLYEKLKSQILNLNDL